MHDSWRTNIGRTRLHSSTSLDDRIGLSTRDDPVPRVRLRPTSPQCRDPHGAADRGAVGLAPGNATIARTEVAQSSGGSGRSRTVTGVRARPEPAFPGARSLVPGSSGRGSDAGVRSERGRRTRLPRLPARVLSIGARDTSPVARRIGTAPLHRNTMAGLHESADRGVVCSSTECAAGHSRERELLPRDSVRTVRSMCCKGGHSRTTCAVSGCTRRPA